jgi:hypothetical protein
MKLRTRKGLSFLHQWMLGWLFAGFVIVSIMLLLDSQRPKFACIDGTMAFKEKECIDCLTNEHCGFEKICKNKQCVATPCKFNTDCQGLMSQCIYGSCVPSGADLDPDQKTR